MLRHLRKIKVKLYMKKGGQEWSSYLPEQVPANKFLFAGVVPANKFFFGGTVQQISSYLPEQFQYIPSSFWERLQRVLRNSETLGLIGLKPVKIKLVISLWLVLWPIFNLEDEHIIRQAQLGVPHSRIQVELGFILQAWTCQILNFKKNPRQSQWGGEWDTAFTLLTRVTHGVGTLHNKERWGGDTVHTLLMGGTIGVGTPHNIEIKSLAVGGWGVCGWVVQVRK